MAGIKSKDKKAGDKEKIVLEKISSAIPDLEDGEEADDDQEQDGGMCIQRGLGGWLLTSSTEVDSNFDDESMGGDYDAEQYFDNGEDNSEGEGGGGNDEDY